MNNQILIPTLLAYSALFGAVAVHDRTRVVMVRLRAIIKAIKIFLDMNQSNATKARALIALLFRSPKPVINDSH